MKMKNEVTLFKTVTTAVMSALTSLFGALAIPILLMVSSNIIDYITGLIAAPQRGEGINSYKGIRGITKKVCMWLLVAVGAIVDQLLKYASVTLGFTMPFTFLVATVVTIWIICNEIISILENLADIGVPVPGFLNPLVKNIRNQVETITGTEESEEK